MHSEYPKGITQPPLNAAIRTSEKWDNMVRHLGYEPVTLNDEEHLQTKGLIPTDVELIQESQERLKGVKGIPDGDLSPWQLASLALARAIALKKTGSLPATVQAALIPPASDRVRTAGLYARAGRIIYISGEQLETGRASVDTVIHEVAHDNSGAEDGEEEHDREIVRVAQNVVQLTSEGYFDKYLRGENFQW